MDENVNLLEELNRLIDKAATTQARHVRLAQATRDYPLGEIEKARMDYLYAAGELAAYLIEYRDDIQFIDRLTAPVAATPAPRGEADDAPTTFKPGDLVKSSVSGIDYTVAESDDDITTMTDGTMIKTFNVEKRIAPPPAAATAPNRAPATRITSGPKLSNRERIVMNEISGGRYVKEWKIRALMGLKDPHKFMLGLASKGLVFQHPVDPQLWRTASEGK